MQAIEIEKEEKLNTEEIKELFEIIFKELNGENYWKTISDKESTFDKTSKAISKILENKEDISETYYKDILEKFINYLKQFLST